MTFSEFIIGERGREFYNKSLSICIDNGLTIESHLESIYTKYKNFHSDNMASCMLSILDSLKLHDNSHLSTDETLSEIMFRKMRAYDIDLNKELGFTHLKPVRSN